MTDANSIAKEWERRERERESRPTPTSPGRWGTFSYWSTVEEMKEGADPFQSEHVRVRIDGPVVILEDEEGELELFNLAPGSYACFVRDRRAGE